MEILALTSKDELWVSTISYIENCGWGTSLAKKMKENQFKSWERVVIAIEEEIEGFCTIVENDNMEDLTYTPFIGYVFVNEKYRGKRISQQMISFAEAYLRKLGYKNVHIVSGHTGLYEKYGYEVLTEDAYDYKNRKTKVFLKEL